MTALAHEPHPVTRAVAEVRVHLGAVTGTPVWSMSPAQTTTALAEVQAARAQLAELEARLLAHADRIDLRAETGATNTANWHAVTTRTTRTTAHRAMRLATGLETRHLTRTALAAGRIHVEQAETILRALDELPTDLDPAVVEQAERHLLDQTGSFDAKALRQLGRHVLHVAAPDAADAHQATLLDREERAAAAATRLTVYDDGHGRLHGRFTIDATVTGAMLKKALWAIAAPKHQASKGVTRGPSANAAPPPSGSGKRSSS